MGEGFRPVRVTRLGLGRQAAWEWREPTCGPYLLCLLQFPPIQINLTSILQAGNGPRETKLSAQGPTARVSLVLWPSDRGEGMGSAI